MGAMEVETTVEIMEIMVAMAVTEAMADMEVR